jgi:adenosine deaminase
MDSLRKNAKRLAELHFHLGQTVDPPVLWSIAHQQGIKLPTKDYHEFFDLITLNKEHTTWDDYHKLFHWTELIQSSPLAMERAVYETISGAYRVNNTVLQEPGFNPIYRNRSGEQDLDHMILAALRGMEKALIEFPQVKAGMIFFLDRRLPYKINEVIVEKAIKYKSRGVIGIDIAGPNKAGFKYDDYVELYKKAKKYGLKTSVHTGEDGTPEEMDYVISILELDRINHGIKSVYSKDLMDKVKNKDLTLCVCPTSNLKVGFVKDLNHLKDILRTLFDNQVKFCINTDNPIMLRTNLLKEIAIIKDNGILTEAEIDQTIKWAFEATFIPVDKMGEENLYL